MTDNVAMNFRKSGLAKQRQAAKAAAPPERSGLSTVGLGLAALAIGFGTIAWFKPGLLDPALLNGIVPARVAAWFGGGTAAPAPGAGGVPRFIAPVSGVREISGSTTGMAAMGPQALAQTYVPVGPVVLRTRDSYVEIDGPRLLPPPIGRNRNQGSVLDHAGRLGNALRALAYTPCDQHLRYLAAANINLFIAGFHPPRTAVATGAAPNQVFWSQPEANAVRRVARELSSKGALAPADFGLDTSPEVKGLFRDAPAGPLSCG